MLDVEITVQCKLGQNDSETPISTNKLDMMVRIYNPSYTGGIGPRLAQIKSKTPSKNNLKAQRAGGMTQVEECLPLKDKALSSNPSTKRKGKRMQLEHSISTLY
jgi:hypothetical protein